MRRPFLICVALVTAGLFLMKPWANQRKVPLQAPAVHYTSAATMTVMTNPAAPGSEEESEPVEVIDLSQLPLQKPELVALPELPPEFLSALAVKPHAEETPAGPTPVVPAFLPLAADHDPAEPPLAAPPGWTRVVRFIWGLRASDATVPNGLVPVMPLKSSYHHDHPECPYIGARPEGGSHARSASKASGEEAQDAPVKKNPANRNTLEIRPGDLPTGWLWKPF